MLYSSTFHKLIILFCFLSVHSENIYSQSGTTSGILAPRNRLAFADHLYCEKDYLRASAEYISYLNSFRSDTVVFKTALSLRHAGYTGEALEYFGKINEGDNLLEEARYEYLITYFLSDSIGKFLSRSKDYDNLTEVYRKRINKLIRISELRYSDPVDSNDIYSAFDGTELVSIRDFFGRRIDPGYKDPALAGLMSAVIPGSGKIYTGNYGDGITAFLITGLFAFLAYDNFEAGHQFRAWLFTGLGLFFYGGNVYGSIASAQIFNASVRFNFESDIDLFVKSKNYFMPDYGFLCK